MASLRSELSFKSPYYISKYRYLELKNFCLQYPEWKKWFNNLSYYAQVGGEVKGSDISKPVESLVIRRDRYLRLMKMVEQSAIEADGCIYEWIVRAVTEGIGYGALDVPCSRDYYYDRYRRFFYILDKVRE